MTKKGKSFWNKIALDFKSLILGSIILNILFLLFGIIIYLNPLVAVNTVGIIIGIYFMIFGVFSIYEFFMRKMVPIFNFKIMMGVLSIVLGFLVILNPFHLIKILTFSLGLYLCFLAIFKGIEAIKLKKYKYEGWLLQFVISILMLIFGVFITINPMASMDIIEATAIFIILSSILEICNMVLLYSKAKDILKLLK